MDGVKTVLVSVAGALILLLAVADALLTTVRAGRAAGPVTKRLAELLWRFALRLKPGLGPPPGTGPVITFAVVAMWLLLFLGGWYLIFSASPASVVDTDGRPADPWARLYFTAYTISTLGIGDYVPSGAVWQVLTGFAAITAFGLATLVITYVASLNSAVAAKRQFARHVSGLGTSPADILQSSWTGNDFRLLEDKLLSLTGDIHGLVEAQLTYPLLHYFTTRQLTAADWPAIATLNELVLLLDHYVDRTYRPAPLALDPLRRAIESYLDILPRKPVETSCTKDPALPDTTALGDAGIKITSPSSPSDDDLRRRSRLRAVLSRQGWPWELALGLVAPGKT